MSSSTSTMGCAMGCATGVVKYLLFAFNLIFALLGLAMVSLGAVAWAQYHEASNSLSYHIKDPPIALVGMGVVVFIIAFLGCCGAIRESRWMVMTVTYVIVLVILLLVEIVLGLRLVINQKTLMISTGSMMTKALDEYTTDANSRKIMDKLQTDFVCCGVNGPSDYAQVFGNDSVPASCCVSNVTETCTQLPGNEMVHQEGCLEKLSVVFWMITKWVGIAYIVFGVIELVGIIFAVFLLYSFKSEWRRLSV